LYDNRRVADELFDLDLLAEEDSFEIDAQSAHLFKHPTLGIENIREVWASDPMSLPRQTTPLADGRRPRRQRPDVPLVPSRDGNPKRCRPSAAIGPPNTSLTNTGETD
jgi:hypothetical protein